MNTKFGPVYITFARMPLYGNEESYELIGEKEKKDGVEAADKGRRS